VANGLHRADLLRPRSYDPRLPESMRLFVQRIPRDDAAIAALEAEVVGFLGEVDETVAQRLRARYEAGLGETLKASLEAAFRRLPDGSQTHPRRLEGDRDERLRVGVPVR
jgi:hypothetical protein